MSDHNIEERARLIAFNKLAELSQSEVSRRRTVRPERIGQCLSHIKPVICEDKTARSGKLVDQNDIESSFEKAVDN